VTDLLKVKELDVVFHTGTRWTRRQVVDALRNVSISVPARTRYGIVGESGSGKSTLARAVVGLVKPTRGEIYFDGERIRDAASEPKILPTKIQVVFQDPFGSLDPRQRILDSVIEPLKTNGLYSKGESESQVQALFEKTGLRSEILGRFPHQLSGGQRQRASIVRAIMLKPDLLIFDEPTSSLDLSTQAQVARLIRDISAELGFTYIFISHNLELVWFMCDIICVMYRGEVVEVNDRTSIFSNPMETYTKELVSSVTTYETAYSKRHLRIQ
jgi:oligopeptide transport system ATP-binding protein